MSFSASLPDQFDQGDQRERGPCIGFLAGLLKQARRQISSDGQPSTEFAQLIFRAFYPPDHFLAVVVSLHWQ